MKLIVTNKRFNVGPPAAATRGDKQFGTGGSYGEWVFDLNDCDYRLESVPEKGVVQVRIDSVNSSKLWPYKDPSLNTLKVGDVVTVPFGFYDDIKLGVVAHVGPSTFSGPLKYVHRRLVEDILPPF